ncbi:hypothetical protein FRC14_000400 [Serendipita sp. 396]|nr:hypothetical protein FRC14_000400 [Serendipita sp. 396]KAG8777147.1 hypothetical protein FRC15_011511 [Serendipita sp. 397]KAG8816904.1 hypothetical protein FRC19_011716 [Serendipita sp. 401]KAG9052845.1 hypothetical protein FS842_009159 [Serendipita sp. 407]
MESESDNKNTDSGPSETYPDDASSHRFDIVSNLPFYLSALILEDVAQSGDSDIDPKVTDGSRLRVSCTIAGVCRSWRRIALDVPFLWSHIVISVRWSVTETTDNILTLVSPRLKSYPASIVINDFQGGEDSAIDPCHLERIEQIRHLHIRFQLDNELNDNGLLRLLGRLQHPPEILTLDCGPVAIEPDLASTHITWSLRIIIDAIPTTRHLCLLFLGPLLEISKEELWPSVEVLEIEKPDKPFPLPKLLAALPNLRSLIIRTNQHEYDPYAYDWSHPPSHNGISYLKLPDVSFVGWDSGQTRDRGMFPALTELDVSNDRGLQGFMKSHPHVRDVLCEGHPYPETGRR